MVSFPAEMVSDVSAAAQPVRANATMAAAAIPALRRDSLLFLDMFFLFLFVSGSRCIQWNH
jgi:hypothetical protein